MRSRPIQLTIDHLVPSALGGTDDIENLVSACSDCNSGFRDGQMFESGRLGNMYAVMESSEYLPWLVHPYAP